MPKKTSQNLPGEKKAYSNLVIQAGELHFYLQYKNIKTPNYFDSFYVHFIPTVIISFAVKLHSVVTTLNIR